MLVKNEPYIKGFPDRTLYVPMSDTLAPPVAVFIEFKRPGEEPEPIQLHWHGVLTAMGFEVVVVHTREEFNEVLDRYC